MRFMRFASALLVTILAVLFPVAARAGETRPLTFELGGLTVTAQVPAGWTMSEGSPPSFSDAGGKKASISFAGTVMPGDDNTYKVMHKAALDSNAARVRSGELVKNEEKAIDGFTGVLTLESARDPNLRRYQWVAYGRGGFYTVMMASTSDAFEGYLPTFNAFLDSLKLVVKDAK